GRGRRGGSAQAEGATCKQARRRVRRYRALGVLGGVAGAVAREWSAIRNVATFTGTTLWQRGHSGVILLPATPSRYESGALQCGQGPNDACMDSCDIPTLERS